MTSELERWNHNIAYHPVVLNAVPARAETALDVGCGTGLLTRRLRERVPLVVGIDKDQPSIAAARAASPHDDVDYVLGDFLTFPFGLEAYDVVVSVASLHHMDTRAGLARMRALLRPGGRLVVIGLARNHPVELPRDIAGHVVHHWHKRTSWVRVRPLL